MGKLLSFREKVEEVGRCMICGGCDKDGRVLVVSVGKLAIRVCEHCRKKLTTLLIDLEGR